MRSTKTKLKSQMASDSALSAALLLPGDAESAALLLPGDAVFARDGTKSSCGGWLTPVHTFALCGLLGSMVHSLIVSINSIAMITIAKEFQLSYAQRGFILSAFSLTYAIFQIPGGIFVMRFGPYVGPFVACLGGCLSLAAIPLCVDAFHPTQNVSVADAAQTPNTAAVVSIFYGFMQSSA